MSKKNRALICFLILVVQCFMVWVYGHDVLLIVPSLMLFVFAIFSYETLEKELEEKKWEIISFSLSLENKRNELESLKKYHLDYSMEVEEKISVIDERVSELEDIKNFVKIQDAKRVDEK